MSVGQSSVNWESVAKDLRVCLEKRNACIAELEKRDPRILRCAFCDEEYPPGTPATQHEALTTHIWKCTKHPLRVILTKYQKALDFMDSAMGEGSRRGRPIDLLDKRTYQRMTELCIDARSAAEAAAKGAGT